MSKEAQIQKSKYFTVDAEKEREDIFKLCNIIMEDKWIDRDTLLVNCSPDYTSITTQILNHALSVLNKNELFPVVGLEMPYPNMSQVWDPAEDKYELYDSYLAKWVKKYVTSSQKLLFIESGVIRGRNFNKVRLSLNDKTDRDNYRFASLYVQSNAIIKPDYYVHKFDFERDGGLLFWWENFENPNWNY